MIARINAERSFFQYKDSVQELVRGIIEAYWAVVFARTDVWARRQQVEQGQVAYDRAEARRRQGFGNAAEVAQTRVALANFRVSLIGAEANLLLREDALRNILGLSPSEPRSIVPMTPPLTTRIEPEWDDLLRLAEQRRPDIIELKLIIEADEQALLLARNQALPQLDVSTLYRWNGLEGETPIGSPHRVRPGPVHRLDDRRQLLRAARAPLGAGQPPPGATWSSSATGRTSSRGCTPRPTSSA